MRGIALSLALALPICAGAASIAFSFDDGFDPQTQPEARAWNAAMLKALAEAKVRAILYPVGKRVDSEASLELVRQWSRAGHWIGNHTYSHLNFNARATTLESFVRDVRQNEALLGGLPGWTARLRFPYLKEGETQEKRDQMRAWLSAHRYTSGAVSVDTSDWYYNARFVAWRSEHPSDNPTLFRDVYLKHILDRARYYDDLARKVTGRSIKHVILLHTNAINAAFLPDMITMFRERGWTIVCPSDAYSDPIYASTPATLPAGESIVWALAKEKGIGDLRYPAENDKYEKDALQGF